MGVSLRRRGWMLAAAVVSLSMVLPPLQPAANAAVSSSLRRYPYLTDVVGPYATVNWATATSGSATLKYGISGKESCTARSVAATRLGIVVNGKAESQWKAQLTLTPNTTYCYRVFLGSTDLLGSDPSPKFVTQLPAGSTSAFSFAVFGDWGQGPSSNTHQANVLKRIAQSGARFAITVGDNGYPSGSQTNYGDLVQDGTNISGVFGPNFWRVAGASLPIFPAIGNHGFVRTDAVHPHIANWPQDRAVATSGGTYRAETYCCVDGSASVKAPSAWYAFDAGNARFYVLEAAWTDTSISNDTAYQRDHAYHWLPGTPEYEWLAKDLAANPTKAKFAFFHYPFYSDDSTEPSDPYLLGAQNLEGLLASNGVRLAFTGHAHIYQRNRPSPMGVVTYVTGGGGSKMEPVAGKGCSAIDAYAIGWAYASSRGSACGAATRPTSLDQVFHFLKVTVNGKSVTVTPIDEMGRVFDQQTYTVP